MLSMTNGFKKVKKTKYQASNRVASIIEVDEKNIKLPRFS
jgi:hypothetical protein